MRIILLLSILTLAAGCASTPKESDPAASPEPDAPAAAEPAAPEPIVIIESDPVPPSPGRVTYEVPVAILSEAVRIIGQQQGGGVVLMHGLGFETIDDVQWSNAPLDEALADISAKATLLRHDTPYYTFLYPQGYGALVYMNTAERVPADARDRTAAIAFGDGSLLASALALLSHNTGLTVIADNAVGAARTGELWVPTAPLPMLLDAILQSARVVVEDVVVETGPDFVFLWTERPQPEPLLNEATLNDEQQAWLDERVSLYLPRAPSSEQQLPLRYDPIPLSEALSEIGAQLGVDVKMQRGLENLPLNQCAMIDLPRRRILDLLVRQWLVPRFGYTLNEKGVAFRRR